ncbi:hypothetical protein BG46_01510 [Brucella anthropi]|uniref:hypothetical protein n=1 Tax=Brucella anthropi TaxID=529 RepID=UPI0004457AE2|nr:hypothetical protein [Brucella anthropi]EXL08580.1 hypothetical protein BG46_01510 [Brucella anthropi]
MIVVHDEKGMILFISTYHAGEDYEAELTKQGYQFVSYDEPADAIELVGSYFVEAGEVRPRPAIDLDKTEVALGETIVIDNLPAVATVRIDDLSYAVEGGRLEFEAEHPGRYAIQIDAWPCLPFQAEVIVQ